MTADDPSVSIAKTGWEELESHICITSTQTSLILSGKALNPYLFWSYQRNPRLHCKTVKPKNKQIFALEQVETPSQATSKKTFWLQGGFLPAL